MATLSCLHLTKTWRVLCSTCMHCFGMLLCGCSGYLTDHAVFTTAGSS